MSAFYQAFCVWQAAGKFTSLTNFQNALPNPHRAYQDIKRKDYDFQAPDVTRTVARTLPYIAWTGPILRAFQSPGPVALLKNGVETGRASSCAPDWRNGNADARYIAPHDTLVIADLKGPGRIVHIWFTIAHQAKYYSRLMSIRMYWDGEKNPSVECPLGDFFVLGHGCSS